MNWTKYKRFYQIHLIILLFWKIRKFTFINSNHNIIYILDFYLKDININLLL